MPAPLKLRTGVAQPVSRNIPLTAADGVRALITSTSGVALRGGPLAKLPVVHQHIVSLIIDRVVKTPGTVGGKARIQGTRIPVWILESYRRQGGSDAEILLDYPSLSQADLDAAWAYIATHPGEVDADIRANE